MADEKITFAASESGAKSWQKILKRNPKGTAFTATDVGWLRPKDTRVNLLTKLDRQDKQNFYKVNVLEAGKFTITTKADADIRIQVMDANHRVIMDSKPKMGVASKNFNAMARDEFSLKSGTHYVKISRADGVSATQPVNVALQMVMGNGTYKHDYLTREVAPTDQERFAALFSPAAPSSVASSFLSDFAGTSSHNLLNPPQIGKILSVLA